MTFAFLGHLNDFENIRSQILNSKSLLSIDEVYVQCEAEKHRQQIMIGKDWDETR